MAKPLKVRFTEAEDRVIRELAAEERQSISDVVREAVRRQLAEMGRLPAGDEEGREGDNNAG